MTYALRFAAAAILMCGAMALAVAGAMLTWFAIADAFVAGPESLAPLRLATGSLSLSCGLGAGSWLLAELRFSLRTLLACVTLLAIGAALLAG